MPETLSEDRRKSLTVVVGFGIDEVYGEIQTVRRHGNTSNTVFDFDYYSYHYALRYESRAVGALTVTRSRDGEIDCANNYPQWITSRFGPQITSGCKFRIIRGTHSGPSTVRRMLRTVLIHQLKDGMRLDLVNVETRLIPLYSWLGYASVCDQTFRHPTLGTTSHAMALPADPTRRSQFRDLFKNLADPISLPEIKGA